MAVIPEPKGIPILGNLLDIDQELPIGSFVSLADQYGEIYRIRLGNRRVIILSSQALVHETCDEHRFQKCITSVLGQIRNGVHDGLFTARNEEENWGIAHRVLMPAFGPSSIRKMFDEMYDIASQLALKWARFGENQPIMVTNDFTRLTLDTLALCSMNFRFNSFYSPTLHPFIEAMGNFLTESGARTRRLPLPSIFFRRDDEDFERNIRVLRDTAKNVLATRKSNGSNRHDLLHAMLEGTDAKTGKRMSDESIMDNLITFLVAGHETTSGLLSFALYNLCKHPEAFQKAQREVDNVLGSESVRFHHLSKLSYLSAVLRETLRLNATIPLFAVEPLEDTVIAGKYSVAKGDVIINLLAKSHLDPVVYGDDAREFVPERMLDEEFYQRNKTFPNSWKPFGNGVRACIGRPFAWQEALLVMAMLLQNFNFVLDDHYNLRIKETLTFKPKDLYVRAILRGGLTPTQLEHRLAGTTYVQDGLDRQKQNVHSTSSNAEKIPLTILFGSNSGTCEHFARRVASDAPGHGFYVVKVDCLNSAKDRLPTSQPVIIITASYEGQPPDNASHFVTWIQELDKNSTPLQGVSYAVFGCGNHEWSNTFQRVPKLIDHVIETLGGKRVADIGLTDVARGEEYNDFETWQKEVLWPQLKQRYHPGADVPQPQPPSAVDVEIFHTRATALDTNVKQAVVVDTKVLAEQTEDTERRKKHMKISLPEGMTYKSGDYLLVLPINPKNTVSRVLRRLGLACDENIRIRSEEYTTLLIGNEMTASEILSSYVELSQPATKRDIFELIRFSDDDQVKSDLLGLTGSKYSNEISAKRISVLDLLERYSSIKVPVGRFLSMMPPMRVRQYSISSSPLAVPSNACITFSVMHAKALSGSDWIFQGVASSFLDSLVPGDVFHVGVVSPKSGFRLPANPATTPIVCIAAGTGLAPFRAFIQERAIMLASGRSLAPALLYYGCHSRRGDDLYRDDMDRWESLGVVDVRRAYSRSSADSNGYKYVHERMWADRSELVTLWKQHAKFYVCGSSRVSAAVKMAAIRIRQETQRQKGIEEDEKSAEHWIDSTRNSRYVVDMFD